MRIFTAFAICAYSVLITEGTAFAQPQPQVITTITAQQVAAVLQSGGYRASVITGNDGSKYVKSSMNGVNILVFLSGCTDGNCTSLEFYAGWQKDPSLTVNYANAWNAQWRYAKAKIDSEGSFLFSYDVNLAGGVTSDNIKLDAQLFEYLLSELGKFTAK
jgi:hypothetical protein